MRARRSLVSVVDDEESVRGDYAIATLLAAIAQAGVAEMVT